MVELLMGEGFGAAIGSLSLNGVLIIGIVWVTKQWMKERASKDEIVGQVIKLTVNYETKLDELNSGKATKENEILAAISSLKDIVIFKR